jgi:hypothetical protein
MLGTLYTGNHANDIMAKKLQAIGYKEEDASEMDVSSIHNCTPALCAKPGKCMHVSQASFS